MKMYTLTCYILYGDGENTNHNRDKIKLWKSNETRIILQMKYSFILVNKQRTQRKQKRTKQSRLLKKRKKKK